MSTIEGSVDPKFARVRDVLADNVAKGVELGAAVSVVVDGRTVVDVWGGHADLARTRPWTRDTLVNVYSATKGIAAIAALRLVDRGLLDLDRRAADYWPEFAAHGKGDVPVRWLFCHKAGVPGVRQPITLDDLYDFPRYAGLIAAETPFWTPGTQHGYHAISIGHLLGTLIRRLDGRSIGRFVQEELSGPFGLDFHIGCGPELDGRIADMQMPPPPAPGEPDLIAELMKHPGSPGFQAFFNPVAIHPDVVNSRGWRGAELAGGNGHGTARGLARIYGALGAVPRAGRMPGRDHDPFRPRLHDDPARHPRLRLRAGAPHLRAPGRRRLARLRGPGRADRLRLRDEPDAGRRAVRRARAGADRRPLRQPVKAGGDGRGRRPRTATERSGPGGRVRPRPPRRCRRSRTTPGRPHRPCPPRPGRGS
jgi:CubicO group peptidase (beta-lactamase class C family)